MPSYDYIFTGTGAAALSLLTRMIESGRFNDRKILLIDRAEKNQNDRTWCFWQKEAGYFEHLVYRNWDQLSFHSKEYSKNLHNQPYQYKMIRGIDFYRYCFDKINNHPGIDRIFGDIELTTRKDVKPSLQVNGESVDIGKALVFNSIYKDPATEKKGIHFLQHFKGWIIDTGNKKFDSSKATLMDFRVHQKHGASFVYVLPLSENRLLVEYTLFTAKLLRNEEYDAELQYYINHFLQLNDFSIVDQEYGVIPMSTASFPSEQEGIYNIGTAGGQTKASTGYTFQFIQKQANTIFQQLLNNQPIEFSNQTKGRFHYYDKVLLTVLADGKLGGDQVFSRLFARNKAASIFKFLDNESSLIEDIRIMSTLPFFPFLNAGWKALF
jgi:lycopene beta-cyclase